MSERQTIFERFAQLPSPLRFAGYGVLALLLFLFWNDYIAPLKRSWTQQADKIQTDVRNVRDAARLRAEIALLDDVIVSLGPVEVPRSADIASTAVHRQINEVLRSHSGVTQDSFTLTPRGNVQGRELLSITGGQQPQLLSGELRFDAAPDVAISIIRQLESSPEIEAVTLVQLTRTTGRRVSVRMNIEAWVVPAPSRGGRSA